MYRSLSLFFYMFIFSFAAKAESLKCSEHRSPLICKNKQGKVVDALNPASHGNSTLTGEIFHYADEQEKQLMRWESYIDGKQSGLRYYFSNGNLEREYHYNQGKKEGAATEYNEKKQLMRKETWANDQLNGPFEFYDQYSGKLKRKGVYKDGYQQGFITEFVENNKQQVFCFQNGYAKDDWSLCDVKFKNKPREEIQYYDNGSIKSKKNFINDKLEGAYIFYSLSGKVSEQGQYKTGDRIGEWIWNDRNGLKIKTANYKSKEDFTESKIHPNGQVAEEVTKKAGKMVSLVEYYMNGQKKSELLFEKPDEIAKYKSYDDQGRVTEEGKKVALENSGYRSSEVLLGFDGLIKNYNYEKNIRTECEMKENKKSGWCKTYDMTSKQILSEKKYENYNLLAEKIYENGKLKSSKEFFEDGSEKK